MNAKDRQSALAAAIILGGVAILFLAMPTMVNWLGEISPWLAYALVIAFTLGFFAIFWLRARHQNKKRST